MQVLKPRLESRRVSIALRVEDREDGGVRVRSPDEPGLLLGGVDRGRVLARVPAALRGMLERNRGIRIEQLTLHDDHVDIDYVEAV